jgi:hypothetical protein
VDRFQFSHRRVPSSHPGLLNLRCFPTLVRALFARTPRDLEELPLVAIFEMLGSFEYLPYEVKSVRAVLDFEVETLLRLFVPLSCLFLNQLVIFCLGLNGIPEVLCFGLATRANSTPLGR